MKIYLKDIKNIDWLNDCISQQSWGKTFLNLSDFFVFNYNLDEANSSINIVSAKQLSQLNDGMYQNMNAEHVGYMREPFDTKNYLFFTILKSACKTKEDNDKLIDLFIGYKSLDIVTSKKNLKNYIIGSMPVTSRINFSTAINEFFLNDKAINGIVMVYELIDAFTRKSVGKSIYGDLLTKIVRAIKSPNGGLIPEMAGSTMRYMIVGELAVGSNNVDLQKAKDLYRGTNSVYDVFIETGWYFNEFDNKWRKKISDDSFSFDINKVSQKNGEYWVKDDIVKTSNENLKIAKDIVENKTSIIELIADLGYKTKLGDYISYEDVFKLYPELPNIYSFLSANVLKDANYSFYFSDSPNSLVLVYGDKFKINNFDELKYTALHEMQHYIQHFEDFGNGGNLELANILSVAGGESTKSFISSVGALKKRFMEVCTLIPIEEYTILTDNLNRDYNKGFQNNDKKRVNINGRNLFIDVLVYYKSILEQLTYKTRNITSIEGNSTSIAYMLLVIYSLIEENLYIEKFISDNIGKEYIDLFKNSLVQTKNLLKKEMKLNKDGWTPQDIYILNFQLYESLAGEIEARYTQQTSRMPQALVNYFNFYTSETINPTKVGIINNSILEDGGNCVAGLETYKDSYIMHLPEEFINSINVLHETGHILFDLLKDKVYCMVNANISEEHFCDCFVDYIHRRGIDPMLTEDLDNGREKKNLTDFDDLFEEAFFLQKEIIDERGLILRLAFITKILK